MQNLLKNLIFFIAVSVIASHAHSQTNWQFLTKSSQGEYFVDINSIFGPEDQKRISINQNLIQPKGEINSYLVKYQINCKTNEYTIISATSYTELGMKGANKNVTITTPTRTAVANSIASKFVGAACQNSDAVRQQIDSLTKSSNQSLKPKSQPITATRIYQNIELKDGGRFELVRDNAVCIVNPKSDELDFRTFLGYLSSNEVAQWIAQQDRLENNNNQTDRWRHIRVTADIFNDMNKLYKTCRYLVGYGTERDSRNFAQEQEKYLIIYPWSSISQGRVISVGPTSDADTARKVYASSMGYKNWDEVTLSVIADGSDASKDSINTLKSIGINNLEDYKSTISRMNSTNYSSETKPSLNLISLFLKDEQDAKKRGLSVVTIKSEREKKELVEKQAREAKADIERKARQEARAKEFPYRAVLTCGMPNHINILACFAKSSYGVDTELTLKNGNSTNMYKAYNLLQVGIEQGDGFHIDLRAGSAIQAQNAHKTLILGLKVYDAKTGKLLTGNQVAQYGIVSFKGK
jgi:hypothetical protein